MPIQDLITRVRVRPLQARDLITRIRTTAAVTLTVTPVVGRTVEPYDTVTLTAAASVIPDTWAWQQTDGATVTLQGTGQTCTFVAPPTLEGTTLTFQVTATKVGASPATGTVSFVVYPHTTWRRAGSDIAPVVINV